MYDSILNNELKDAGVLNYLTSHDDGQPFDNRREMPYKTATMLLLTPGASQIYYGDESARNLIIDGAVGDATLRSSMNWNAIQNSKETRRIIKHWQKLGQFRANHMAVGAGRHQLISKKNGLIFSRTRKEDKVIIGINLPEGEKNIDVSSVFKDSDTLYDAYSKKSLKVIKGIVSINSRFEIILIQKL
jgi:alpha-amylase